MSQNKKLGLVLGAGAARGFAHIGVLEVMFEHRIPVDIITGTSIGALIGGLYATGTDIYFMESYAKKIDLSRFLDFSLRDGGIVRGRRIEGLLRILTGNKSISQLNIPYACAAIDAVTGKSITFSEGGLYEAIRASISMPGIFAPYEINGEHYIDGGTLERMPIRAARDLGADIIVAVDVSWRGQERDVPKNSIQAMQAALSIAGWYISSENEKAADILIAPDVYKTNPFSSKECEFCIGQGRAAAEQAIPQIEALLMR